MNGRAAKPFKLRGVQAMGLPFTHFRVLSGARKAALAGSVAVALGAVSGIPDFGWLEASQLLVALWALRVISRSIEHAPYPLPFHDGTIIAVGAIWCAIITGINAFDKANIGTELIILAGSAALFFAGVRMQASEQPYWFE